MNRIRTIVGLILGFALVAPLAAQGEPDAPSSPTSDAGQIKVDPLDVDQREEVKVRLVLIDAVVLDRNGRTVPDLTLDEFEILVDGKPRPIDTLDVSCPGGATDDPRGVQNPAKRSTPAPLAETKIALVLDYMHLSHIERVRVLEDAREMVRSGTGDEQFMVAALNGGLRVEQVFTADRKAVDRVLKRMEYDISLWMPTFEHLTERPLYTGLGALFAVLERVPGSKSMVLYSSNPASGSQDDLWLADLAAAASSSRCAIYPVHAAGLLTDTPDWQIVPRPG